MRSIQCQYERVGRQYTVIVFVKFILAVLLRLKGMGKLLTQKEFFLFVLSIYYYILCTNKIYTKILEIG